MAHSRWTNRPTEASSSSADQGDCRRLGPLPWWWMGSGPVGTSLSSSAPNPVVLTSSSASLVTSGFSCRSCGVYMAAISTRCNAAAAAREDEEAEAVAAGGKQARKTATAKSSATTQRDLAWAA